MWEKSECGEHLSTSIYRKNQGVEWHFNIPKCPWKVSFTRAKEEGKWGSMDEPPLAGHPLWVPFKRGALLTKSSLDLFGESPKRWLSKKQPKVLFHYSWRHFSASVKSKKYFCRSRAFPVPTKIILDAFQNISGSMIFISGKQPRPFRLLRNISGFLSGKFPEVPITIPVPPKSSRRVPKPLWLNGLLQNNFSVLPELSYLVFSR
jgi:hypothetical protein